MDFLSALSRARLRAALLVAASLATSSCIHAQAIAAPTQETMPAPHKTALADKLTVTANGTSITYTLDQLQAMPQRQVVVHNGHTSVDEMYVGVGLDDLLAKAGISLAGKGAQTVYRSYVRAEGADHYVVLFSASELQLSMHPGDAIVALSMDGKPLGEQGPFKMVLAGEKRPARWVRNLTSLKAVVVE